MRNPRLDGVVVLIVDDNADSLHVAERILTQQGAHVVTATSPGEALRIVGKTPPDVLLCDIGMPEMDGYTLLKKIRELEHQKGKDAHIPAAAITSFSRLADRRQATLASFRYHLLKPVDLDELLSAVAHMAGRSRI